MESKYYPIFIAPLEEKKKQYSRVNYFERQKVIFEERIKWFS